MQGGYVYLSTFACMVMSKYRNGLECHAFRNGYNIYLLMFLIFTWHSISVCCKIHNMISEKVKWNQKGPTWLEDVFALQMWKAGQWNDAKSKDMINFLPWMRWGKRCAESSSGARAQMIKDKKGNSYLTSTTVQVYIYIYIYIYA